MEVKDRHLSRQVHGPGENSPPQPKHEEASHVVSVVSKVTQQVTMSTHRSTIPPSIHPSTDPPLHPSTCPPTRSCIYLSTNPPTCSPSHHTPSLLHYPSPSPTRLSSRPLSA